MVSLAFARDLLLPGLADAEDKIGGVWMDARADSSGVALWAWKKYPGKDSYESYLRAKRDKAISIDVISKDQIDDNSLKRHSCLDA